MGGAGGGVGGKELVSIGVATCGHTILCDYTFKCQTFKESLTFADLSVPASC